MEQRPSAHSSQDHATSSRHEDYKRIPHSSTEEERAKRWLEWKRRREFEEKHERRKQKMIMEYELKRLERLKSIQQRSSLRRSKSRNRSPKDRSKISSIEQKKQSIIMSEKLDSTAGNSPLFKGPEGTQISATELRSIKVDIHRDISTRKHTTELQRDIINPEDVVLKRREGEGCKPIFEREEIKKAMCNVEEVKEHRTVKAVDHDSLAKPKQTSKKRSVSLSPVRHRSCSSHRSSSQLSRHGDSKYRRGKSDYQSSDGERRRREGSMDRSREHRAGYGESRSRSYGLSRKVDREHTDRRRSSRDRSRSREQVQERREMDFRRSSRERRERSRERSRDVKERARCRELTLPQDHYFRPVPVPIYYGEFPPRPLMFSPVIPISGQVPFVRGRPPVMGAVRSFPPRIPPAVFRMAPPNPRY